MVFLANTFCQVQFQRHLSRQFSIAFDLYLAIRANVNQRVQVTLGRDSPDWRLKHACPACTYKLKNEHPLLFKMLYAMDGNDSLRRVLRRSPSDDDESLGASCEHTSDQQVPGDCYLSREYVDKWAEGVLQDMMSADSSAVCSLRMGHCINHLTAYFLL